VYITLGDHPVSDNVGFGTVIAFPSVAPRLRWEFPSVPLHAINIGLSPIKSFNDTLNDGAELLVSPEVVAGPECFMKITFRLMPLLMLRFVKAPHFNNRSFVIPTALYLAVGHAADGSATLTKNLMPV
jgi:hypothetical protein